MSQYALPLALPAVYAADNFFVSECNGQAHRLVTAWPDWPSRALILVGDTGSGKTHLGHIWAARAQAGIIPAENIDAPGSGNRLIENIERANPRALLHLINAGHEQGDFLLLTSAEPPARLPFTLPDLTSRLNALPVAEILPPDDAALTGVLRKQFADRQLKVEEDVLAFLLPRLERSFLKINEAVEILDKQTLMEHKTLTIPFVKRALKL